MEGIGHHVTQAAEFIYLVFSPVRKNSPYIYVYIYRGLIESESYLEGAVI